jgi:hypothetical protein
MHLFTRNSPYYHFLKYLLLLLKQPVYYYLILSHIIAPGGTYRLSGDAIARLFYPSSYSQSKRNDNPIYMIAAIWFGYAALWQRRSIISSASARTSQCTQPTVTEGVSERRHCLHRQMVLTQSTPQSHSASIHV